MLTENYLVLLCNPTFTLFDNERHFQFFFNFFFFLQFNGSDSHDIGQSSEMLCSTISKLNLPTPTFTSGASCAGLMFDIIGHAMCTKLLHTLQNGRCIVLWRAANKTFPFLGAWSTLVWTVTPSSPSSPVTIMISGMGTCSVRRRNTVYSRNANHQYCCTKKNLHIF